LTQGVPDVKLRPLFSAVNGQILLLKLQVLGTLLVFIEGVCDVTGRYTSFANTLIAYKNQLPLEVRRFVREFGIFIDHLY
jgi:hypothetical protein